MIRNQNGTSSATSPETERKHCAAETATGGATLAMRWTACSGNGDVACNGCPQLLNVADVFVMSTLVPCVQRFSVHDLLLVVSSQDLCNVVFTGTPGVPDLRSAADTADGANFVIF